ncbi:CopD family protein [Chryseobacterium sp. S90]|uniref:CopD family protein n=1 Tax=Chryseobacterium sp. S90 TaxID=3395373 RepID=UPI0039BCD65B
MFSITIKLLHIFSIVCYFLGIFYVGQLFLSYKHTNQFSRLKKKILRRQYLFRIERIWNMIVVPGGLIMLTTGVILFFLNKQLVKMQWFDLKLIFLSMLSTYHYWVFEKIRYLKALCGYDFNMSSIKLQKINEIGILLLFLLGCSVVLKYTIKIHYGFIITEVIILMFLLIAAFKLFKKEK